MINFLLKFLFSKLEYKWEIIYLHLNPFLKVIQIK
jgi:hypothetical protein